MSEKVQEPTAHDEKSRAAALVEALKAELEGARDAAHRKLIEAEIARHSKTSGAGKA